jgi:small Trp-rich protein
MYFIVVGVVLLGLKVADFGPVGQWSWWLVLAPFGLAAVWWAWADASGWSKRRAMDRMQEKKVERRRRNMEALGTEPKRRR